MQSHGKGTRANGCSKSITPSEFSLLKLIVPVETGEGGAGGERVTDGRTTVSVKFKTGAFDSDTNKRSSTRYLKWLITSN